jgi:hypothetical protein
MQFMTLGNDRQADAILTPEVLQEFEDLIEDWRSSYPTCDELESGGVGDTDSLAALILDWTRKHLRKALDVP